MNRLRALPLELIVLAYCLVYLPNVMVLKLATSGAITSTSPRISSWMKGMLTPSIVKDSGTVNSTSAVPMPDKKV